MSETIKFDVSVRVVARTGESEAYTHDFFLRVLPQLPIDFNFCFHIYLTILKSSALMMLVAGVSTSGSSTHIRLKLSTVLAIGRKLTLLFIS